MKLQISLAFLIVIAVSCSPVSLNKSSGTHFEVSVKPEQPDYADLYYWAAHPGKWDPSDSCLLYTSDAADE